MMYDISDRKHIEFDLIQERERFRLLVQSSPNGIVILVDDLIRFANPVAEEGFGTDGALEGEQFQNLFPEGVRERIVKSIQDTRNGKEVDEWELELSNGSRWTLKWRLTIFDGQPAVQVSLSDVTDRHVLMQERIRAEVAEEAPGRSRSSLLSLTKVVETMKKMSRMKTTSISGEMSTSAPPPLSLPTSRLMLPPLPVMFPRSAALPSAAAAPPGTADGGPEPAR